MNKTLSLLQKGAFLKLGFLLFLFLFSGLVNAQERDIIIAMDESGSMKGAKFEGINYAIQLMGAMMNENDRLYVIRGEGRETSEILSYAKQDGINFVGRFQMFGGNQESKVIYPAVDLLKKDPHRKKTLILFGDGAWKPYPDAIYSELTKVYREFTPQVYFFRIGNSAANLNGMTNLDRELEDITHLEVIKTDGTNVNQLKTNLEILAKVVAGAHEGQISVQHKGDRITFKSKFPLRKLIVLNQKNIDIQNIGSLVAIEGEPSLKINENIELSNFGINPQAPVFSKLSGRYFSITDQNDGIIQPGVEYSFNFDQDIDINDVLVIPITALDLKAELKGEFKSYDPSTNTYTVCADSKDLKIEAMLTDQIGSQVDLKGLSGLSFVASDGTNDITLSLQPFSASGPLVISQDTTYINIEAEYDGYFHKIADVAKIVREKCIPPIKEDLSVNITLPEKSFLDYTENGYCFLAEIHSTTEGTISPEFYDLTFEDVPWHMDYTVEKKGMQFEVCFEPKDLPCDCLIPAETFKGTLLAVANTHTKSSIKGTWQLSLKKENSFWTLCKGCILTLLITLGALWLLWAIIKKPRFYKSARVIYWEEYTDKLYQEKNERKRSLKTNFFNRYFVPKIAERKYVNTIKMTFIASGDKKMILLSKKSVMKGMKADGEKLDPAEKRDIPLYDNSQVSYTKGNVKLVVRIQTKR